LTQRAKEKTILCFVARRIKNGSSIHETAKESIVKSFDLPNESSARSDLVKYLESIGSQALDGQGRLNVERNVLAPLIMLVESIQLARSSGPIEEELFFHFIRDLTAQWDHSKRTEGIGRLIEGLERLRARQPSIA
jgi:hypothetical protein